ncbi:MAG: type II toxin-antitoxin system HicB family antitoxin [Patescibacteria group bacterium]|nr:type II toxin-antitoxin system HicB family antitoxin [Patescibacteria group bacterium]
MKRKIVEKVLRYNAVFEPCEEGGFVVTVPKLPGLTTEGNSFEKALKNAKDAIDGYLHILQEANEAIPEPDEKVFTTPIEIKLPINQFACA